MYYPTFNHVKKKKESRIVINILSTNISRNFSEDLRVINHWSRSYEPYHNDFQFINENNWFHFASARSNTKITQNLRRNIINLTIMLVKFRDYIYIYIYLLLFLFFSIVVNWRTLSVKKTELIIIIIAISKNSKSTMKLLIVMNLRDFFQKTSTHAFFHKKTITNRARISFFNCIWNENFNEFK